MRVQVCVSRCAAVFGLWLLLASQSLAGPPVALTDPLSPADEQKTFKLRPGFEIQLVASEPDIQKPMNLAFDAQGRLWVSHSIEYPFAATDPSKARDGVTILDGIGPDGRATKISKFATNLNIPIGILPLPGAKEAIVWSIPYIWKVTDTDNDGAADKREILYGPFDFADTHGDQNAFRLGADGWVYACHGFRNASKVKLRGEGPVVLEMQSGNTYRFKTDGSAIEQISWGQVNPFGMCVDARGDMFTADCHSKPVTMILRGGYYDSFGKPHDGLGFAPITTSDDHGSTGIGGIAAYSAQQFPGEYQGSMFLCNVVTNLLHRDIVQYRGSSPWIEKSEEFVTSSDHWCHPVDIQLGPDGALYFADFYNSIIGHYEVDLNHPRRDRERGRVWRIVHTGAEAKQSPPSLPNLAALSQKELIASLSDRNDTVRQLAGYDYETRFGAEGIARLQERLDGPAKADQPVDSLTFDPKASERVQTLWMLWRNGKLDAGLIARFSHDPAALVRIHLIRALGQTGDWNTDQTAVVRTALADPDPFVRRAAAEAIARHPDPAHLKPLLESLRVAAPDDLQLIHATRIALRNQLRSSAAIEQIASLSLSKEELAKIVDIALTVPTEAAAWFSFDYVRQHEVAQPVVESCLSHVARNVGEKRLDEVAQYVQQQFPNDQFRQTVLFQAIFNGLTQRGKKLQLRTSLGQWGEKLANLLLDPKSVRSIPWENLPLPGVASASPWGVTHRGSTDEDTKALFFDSIANGEQLTGVLRSAPFVIPDSFTFWMCGHNGLPGTNPPPVNHVRLKLAETGEVIAREIPPRNDVAREYTWDLKKWAGQKAVLEAVDADVGPSYAWLAVGRFSPAVVVSPASGLSFTDAATTMAVQIADQLKLEPLGKPVLNLLKDSHAELPNRIAAATASLNLQPNDGIAVLGQIVQNPEEPAALRTQAAQLLGAVNSQDSRMALANALATAPGPLQQPLALALAGNQLGGELLFSMIANGRASARLLQDKPVLDRLGSLTLPKREERIAELTRGIPAADDRLKALVTKLTAAANASEADPAAGAEVFKKTCAACHRINDVGGKVGPQLDGVGHRGIERLLEDVLDPNRNVDAAFRATVIETKSGLVITGLKLRDEGTTVILGNSEGKEVRVGQDDIDESRLSNLSPMPSNLAEQLKEPELRALLAFLLKQRQAVPKASQ